MSKPAYFIKNSIIMKKKYVIFYLPFLLCLFVVVRVASAQEKLLTPADAAYQNPSLYAKGLQNLQWVPAQNAYSWIVNQTLVKESAFKHKTDTLLRINDLNSALVKLSLKQTKRFPSIHWISDNNFYFTHENRIVNYNLTRHQAVVLNTIPDDAENIDIQKETFKVAFTRKNNLFIVDNGKEKAITNETNSDIVYGANNVHRNEFGIENGTFWSPDGNYLAFYRMDQTMVPDYPIVDITTRIATTQPVKYPMAGETSHQVTLGVYNLTDGSTTYLKTGLLNDQYLTAVTWDQTEEFIYVGVLNRDQNHLKMNKYSAKDGEFISTLFEEKNSKYVEPESGLFFFKQLPDQFFWLSERDGFNHIYHYSTDGKLLGQLTTGNWMVTSINCTDPKGENLFFSATKESPLQKNIYSVNLKNKNIQLLSKQHGTHSAKFSDDCKYVLDQFSNTETPLQIALINTKNKESKLVYNAENPLKDYRLGKTTLSTLKNDEGTELWYRMIKPVDFDSTKKYPAIIYVYGGPHAQLITDSWLAGAGIYLNYLAQQGYVVFTLDNRGSANRGFDFESAIHRQCGTVETEDQMLGYSFLISNAFVDQTRIGVDGWSYGGFMTINMLLENPGKFKAAVAGGPVCDWKYYEIMYGERYMDTPQSNPDGYKKASLIEKAEKLTDRLMIIHCTSDPVVVWQNSMSFVQACINNKVMLDYFIYPGHDHNVSGPDRAHLIMKIEDYFKRNL